MEIIDERKNEEIKGKNVRMVRRKVEISGTKRGMGRKEREWIFKHFTTVSIPMLSL